MKWLEDLCEEEPYTNPKQFEFRVRRSMLIPEAEEYADDKVGEFDESRESLEQWGTRWNVVFCARMEQLVELNNI